MKYDDKYLVDHCIATVKSMIELMLYARYVANGDDNSEFPSMVCNILTNLMGNFTLEFTNYEREDALENNIKSLIAGIREWFEKAEKIKKDAH